MSELARIRLRIIAPRDANGMLMWVLGVESSGPPLVCPGRLDASGRETATLYARSWSENGLSSPASSGDEDWVARKNHGASYKQKAVRGRGTS